MLKYASIALLLWLPCIDIAIAQSLSPDEIMRKSLSAMESIRAANYTFENRERINGKMLAGSQEIRYIQSPFQVHMTFIQPREGTSILYEEGKNNNKIIYDPVGFPYTNLYLDPKGSLARDNNHHTIYNIGFAAMAKVIAELYDSQKGQLSVIEDAATYWVLSLDVPHYQMEPYTVQQNETTSSIAAVHSINEYAIVDANEEVDDFGPLKAGMQINIPNAYTKAMRLLIDKSSYIPLHQSLFDNQGLFEQYTISNLEINPPSNNDFFAQKRKKKWNAD